MQLPEGGEYDQHTVEYQEKLKSRNIILPKVAFELTTPNFILDIANLPSSILMDHGFHKKLKNKGKIVHKRPFFIRIL